MTYYTFGEYVCRKAEKSDISTMYSILEPLVCDTNQGDSIYEVEQRSLYNNIKFCVLQKDAVVVEKDNSIVSVYIGKDNDIINIATEGNDIFATALIMNTALNDIHNKHKESRFLIVNNRARESFNISIPGGDKATSIDPFGHGIVSVEAKQEIGRLFNILKDKYGQNTNT
jgi:hypothetical protein